MGTLLLALALAAGMQFHQDFEKAVLTLTGAACTEDLDESELEHYQSLAEHPLDLNGAGRARLAASRLLSGYQIASLLDYRSHSGDILSYSELALIDGFSPALAESLKPFTILRTGSAPGHTARDGLHGTLTAKCSVRQKDDKVQGTYGAKLHMEAGERLELNWASRTTYSSPEPHFGTASAAYYGRRVLERLVVGNYGARFGQGLALWSGFSLSGVSSVAAFRRNGSGISASSSFSPALLGAAAEFRAGTGTLSCGYAVPGELFCNWTGNGRNITSGATAIHDLGKGRSIATADVRAGFKGVSIFAEAALEHLGGRVSPAAVAGAIYTPRYGTRLALLGRWYSPGFSGAQSGAVKAGSKASDEAGLAAGLQIPWLDAIADAMYRPLRGSRQFKSIVSFHKEFQAFSWLSLEPQARISIRKSGEGTRSDLRGELALKSGPWVLSARGNVLWNRNFSWLWYSEAGARAERASTYLRFTLFKIDDWEDRIYVYERDIPGSFSIPAYYGRGFSLSWCGSAKLRTHSGWEWQLAARAAATRYPWTLNGRSSSTEAKVLLRLSR